MTTLRCPDGTQVTADWDTMTHGDPLVALGAVPRIAVELRGEHLPPDHRFIILDLEPKTEGHRALDVLAHAARWWDRMGAQDAWGGPNDPIGCCTPLYLDVSTMHGGFRQPLP